ncbi:hypothetical protein [Hahella sp. NBU794]|uniref:hypothetical protein n=1 Tax=Hahella sp. NBU794 TaxID=3422590 RepID=UPI003D6FD74E
MSEIIEFTLSFIIFSALSAIISATFSKLTNLDKRFIYGVIGLIIFSSYSMAVTFPVATSGIDIRFVCDTYDIATLNKIRALYPNSAINAFAYLISSPAIALAMLFLSTLFFIEGSYIPNKPHIDKTVKYLLIFMTCISLTFSSEYTEAVYCALE